MRKISAMAMLALFGTAGVLLACDKHKAGKVVLAGAKIAPCCKTTFDNAVAGVLKTMPSMAYRVGDTETRCFQSATAKAGKDGKVQFLVASKAYDTETEATIALAGLLEKEIASLQAVQLSAGGKCYGCPMSAQAALKNGEKMKYRLAGFDFATREEAVRAQKIITCKLTGCDADCLKDCMKNFRGTAQTAGARSGCNKGKAAKAATVAAKSDKPCCAKGNKAKAATVAAVGSPCSKSQAAKAATVAAKDGAPCSKSRAAKAATVVASGSPCSKAAKATTVAAESKGGCCKTAQKRLATAQDQIKLIVETAATLALSS